MRKARRENIEKIVESPLGEYAIDLVTRTLSALLIKGKPAGITETVLMIMLQKKLKKSL